MYPSICHALSTPTSAGHKTNVDWADCLRDNAKFHADFCSALGVLDLRRFLRVAPSALKGKVPLRVLRRFAALFSGFYRR